MERCPLSSREMTHVFTTGLSIRFSLVQHSADIFVMLILMTSTPTSTKSIISHSN